MKEPADIYSLWPNVGEMARDLAIPAVELIRLREANRLPDQKHDNVIVTRAMFMDKRLTHEMLVMIRGRMDSRRKQIGEFYDSLGGVDVISRRLDISKNALHVARFRGQIPRARKYDFAAFAKEREVMFPASLFDPVFKGG